MVSVGEMVALENCRAGGRNDSRIWIDWVGYVVKKSATRIMLQFERPIHREQGDVCFAPFLAGIICHEEKVPLRGLAAGYLLQLTIVNVVRYFLGIPA